MLTPEQMLRITEKCTLECIRQHVGLDRVSYLISAYHKALALSKVSHLPNEAQMLELAGQLEPYNRGAYRYTPVVFNSGGSAAPASAVPSAMMRLFSNLDETVDPGEFTRAFLSIHPFADGNGRTAFIIYNWLNKSLESPEPLPEFHF